MKILIATPTFYENGRLEVEPECVEGVFKQKTTHQYDWYVVTGKYTPDIREKTVAQYDVYNKLKRYVIDGDYDCLLTLESDIIMRGDNVIQKMADFMETGGFMSDKPDIVTAPHRARPHGVGHSHVVLFTLTGKYVWYLMGSLNNYYRMLKWNVPFRVDGSGLGCVLISRKVLEKITFSGNEIVNGVNMGIDTQFFTDCNAQGFKTYCIPVDVGHKDTDGQIYYLDEKFYVDLVDKIVRGEYLKSLLEPRPEDDVTGVLR